eukprot:COSAG05_NODE_5585_length_1135_cov_1.304054_1_plen_81_part_00
MHGGTPSYNRHPPRTAHSADGGLQVRGANAAPHEAWARRGDLCRWGAVRGRVEEDNGHGTPTHWGGRVESGQWKDGKFLG